MEIVVCGKSEHTNIMILVPFTACQTQNSVPCSAVTNSMEQSHSWEANSHSAVQKIPSLLWNQKVHLLCSQKHTTEAYPEPDESSPHPHVLFFKFILILSYVCLGLPSSLFPLGFLTNIYAVSYTMHAKCPAHLILYDLVMLLVLGKKYRLWSSSLFSFLQLPATSSLFIPNILLSVYYLFRVRDHVPFSDCTTNQFYENCDTVCSPYYM
jgi:hypothetical protein